MSTETEMSPTDLGVAVLQDSFSGLRFATDGFEKDIDDTFSQLDAWREALEYTEHDLAEQQASLLLENNRLEQVSHEYHEQTHEELESLRADLQAAEQQLHEERNLREQQQTTESGSLEQSKNDLEAVRQDLLVSQEELLDKQTDLKEAQDESRRFEKEIVLLEMELEKVRQSASDLSNSHAEMKDRFAAESAQKDNELNQTRRALEIETKIAAQSQISPTEGSLVRSDTETLESDPEVAGNHVFGSVMAQFQKLKSQQTQQRRNN